MNKKVGIITGVIIAVLILVFGVSKFKSNDVIQNNTKEMITVTDRNGEKKVPKNPKRVVVLDYGALDTMKAINKEPVGVPKQNLPNYLSMYKDDKYTDIGGVKEFNMEKINELKPDLIIIEGRQASYYDELNKIAPTILLGTDGTDHFGSLEKNAKVIASIYGVEDEVEGKIKDLNARAEKVAKKVKAGNKNALVTMVSEGNISAFGKGSRYSVIYDKFGFTPIDNIEVSKHGKNISSEYLVSKNPEYIFVVDRGAITGDKKPAKDVVENELIKNTKAYKDGNIVYLDAQVWYLGGCGLMSTDLMINEIEKAIN